MRSLKELVIDKLINDGLGWYIIICSVDCHTQSNSNRSSIFPQQSNNNRVIDYDVCEEIQTKLLRKLDYIVRRKLTIQNKIKTIPKDFQEVVSVNVFDPNQPSPVRFIGRYIEIGANFITQNGVLGTIPYERNRIRCRGKRKALHNLFDDGVCYKELKTISGLESTIRCSGCGLPFCSDCVFNRRNENHDFYCEDHL